MNSLAKREKILIILGGSLVFLYFYISVFLSPINISITNEKKVLAAKKVEVASIERLKISNVINNKKLDEYIKKFNDVVIQLPKNDRNPEIAYNLNELSAKSKITINSLSFGAISDYIAKNTAEKVTAESKVSEGKTSTTDTTTGAISQKLKLVPVSIAITGDYESFLSFVSSIETIEADNRLAEIESVSISAKSDSINLVQANILLNYYFSEGTTKEQPNYDNLKDTNVGKDNLFD